MKTTDLSVGPKVCSTLFPRLFKVAFSALFLLAALSGVQSARAQAVPLVFDNNTGMSSSQIYIQFLGGNPVTGTYVDTLTGQTLSLNQNVSYSLAQMSDIQISSLNSGRVYVNYGPTGLSNLGADNGQYTPAAGVTTDPNNNTRYQYFEFTAQKQANNSVNYFGDLSYIDFTAISMSMTATNANGSAINPALVNNPVQLSVNTQQLVNAAAGSAASPNAVEPANSISSTTIGSNFARVISPQFGDPANYHDFSSYLTTLSGSSVNIAGTFVGTGPQPTGLATTQAQTYDFTGTFSGTPTTGGSITLTAVPKANGLSNVNGFGFTPTAPNQPTQGVGYTGVKIVIQESALNSQDGIYGNNVPYEIFDAASPSGTFTTGITNDVFGRAVGDLLAGLSLGDVGSNVAFTTLTGMTINGTFSPAGTHTTIGALPSTAWWSNGSAPNDYTYIPTINSTGTLVSTKVVWADSPSSQGLYFSGAQPGLANADNYNGYAAALTGTGASSTLTAGYGFPLQDRLGANLLTFNTGTSPETQINLILNPDGTSPILTGIWLGTPTGTVISWNTGTNWINNSTGTFTTVGVPPPGASVQFQGALSTAGTLTPNATYVIDTGTNRTVGGIDFNYGAGTFTINNNTLFLSGDIVNSSTNTQTINSNLEFDTNGSVIAAWGNLVLGRNVALTGTTTATFSGNFNSTVNGIVSGTGSILMNGPGGLTLNGTNTFGGGLNLQGGTLSLGNDSALGSGTFTITNTVNEVASASSIAPVNNVNVLQSSGGARTISNNVALAGDVTISGTSGFAFTGPVTLTNTGTTNPSGTFIVAREVTNNVPVTISGPIGESVAGMGFTKSGTATMTFSGATSNTFTGMLSVNQGTLVLAKTSGADAFSMGSTGGTNPVISGLTIGTGLPGNNAIVQLGADGQVPTNGTVTITPTGTLDLQAYNTSFSQLNMAGGVVAGTGTLTLVATLNGTVNTGGVLFNGTGSSTATINSNLNLVSTVVGTTTAIQTFNIGATTAATQLTVNGNLTGNDVSLTKVGSGVLELLGTNNSLTGASTTISISGGVLRTTSLPGASVTVSGGALGTTTPGTVASTITVGNLFSANGAFLLGLGGTNTSDNFDSTGIVSLATTAGSTTTFLFGNDGFTTGSGTFVLITAGSSSDYQNVNLANLQFASVGISGLTGTFSYSADGMQLLFNAVAGVTGTWTSGSSTGTWTIGSNWSNGVPPAGADLTFLGSGTGTTTVTTGTNQTTGAITFSASAGAFIIDTNDANTITLGGTLTNLSPASQTINSSLALNASREINNNGGLLSLAGSVVLSSTGATPGTLTFTGNGNTTVSGQISDGPAAGGSIVMDSTGTLNLMTLGGTNIFTGGVTFAAGTVYISHESDLGNQNSLGNTLVFSGGALETSGTMTFVPTRTIQMLSTGIINTDSNSTLTLEGQITGAGGLTKDGAGQLILNYNGVVSNTYAGATTVNGGSLVLDYAGALGNTSGVTVNNGGSLIINGNFNVNNPLALNGPGDGSQGALALAGGIASYTGTITLGSNTSITDAVSATFGLSGDLYVGSNNLSIIGGAGSVVNLSGTSGSIMGSGQITESGAGFLVNLNGANTTFTGTFDVQQGALSASQATSLGGAQASVIVAAGGALVFTNSAINPPITVNLNSITLSGSGTTSGTSYAGAIDNVGGGTVTINSNISLGTDAEIGSSTGSLTLSGTGSIDTAGHTLTLNNKASQMVISENIIGAGGIASVGTSSVLLSGTNSYTGGTSIADNVSTSIIVASSSALGSSTGTTTIGDLGALQFEGGINVVQQSITLDGVGPANNGALENLSGTNTLSGNIILSNPTTFQADAGELILPGSVTAAAATPLVIQGSGIIDLSGTTAPTNINSIQINSGTLVANNLSGIALTVGPTGIVTGSAPTFSAANISLQPVQLSTISFGTGAQVVMDLGLNITGTYGVIALAHPFSVSGPDVVNFVFNKSSGFTSGSTYILFSAASGAFSFDPNSLTFTSTGTTPVLSGYFTGNNTGAVDFIASSTAAIWTGTASGTGSWTDANRWNIGGGILPAGGSAVAFTSVTGTNVPTVIDTGGNQLAGGIQFLSGSAPLTLENNTIGIYGTIENDSTNTQTISSNLTLVGDTMVNASSGGITLSGTVDFSNYDSAPNLTVEGANTTMISGAVLDSTAGVTGTFNVNGGHVQVSSAGSITGNVFVENGGKIGGSGTINGKVTVGNGGSTYPGDPAVLKATSLEYQAGSTAEFTIATTNSSLHPPTAGIDYDQIQVTGAAADVLQIDPGATVKLDLTPTSLAVLQTNAQNHITDNYFIFGLGSGTSLGEFSDLTLTDGTNTYTQAINNDVADFASLGLQFDFTYTGDATTDSLSGGNDVGFEVLSSTVPEPSDWAPGIVLLLALAIFLRRRNRPARIG